MTHQWADEDDVFILMYAAYWRITSAIDRAVAEAIDGLPDFLAADVERETRATAYAEEQRVWGAGMDRLCELYGLPEGPEVDSRPLEQAVLL